jgi:thymidylate synthase
MQAQTQTKYNPLYKPNQVICGTGQIAIATGWTPRSAIADCLKPHEYAAIGQLYSPTRGISFLLRNLLANPHVRFLVIVNATKADQNAGGVRCLLDFFKNGFRQGKTDTERDCWIINSEIVGYIDFEISYTALDRLRGGVIVPFEAKSIVDALQISRVLSAGPSFSLQPWGTPQIFPLIETIPNVLPGQLYGHRIEGKTIAEAWVKIIHRIKSTGAIRPTGYDGVVQELVDLVAVVTDEPENFYFPEPNYLPVDKTFIENYIPQILEDAPYIEGVKYTYGQRLRSWFGRDQIEDAIAKLIGEIDAASAVMSLWDSGGNIQRRSDGTSDHQHGGSPCLNHIWLRVIDGVLSLTATFRSNDMFAAWPANAMGLRALQQYIRDQIAKRSSYNLKLAPLVTISQSAHIYDDTFENADKLIKTQYAKLCQQKEYNDPAGSFAIALQDSEILVQHLTPGNGEVVGCYSGKSAAKLCREIAADCPALEVSHALYLGAELQKAEVALNSKDAIAYEQDKVLKF